MIYRRRRQKVWDVWLLALLAILGILVILAGCVKRGPIASTDLCRAELQKRDAEIQSLKEQELFEEAMTEDVSRELAATNARIRRYLALHCLCKHKAGLE